MSCSIVIPVYGQADLTERCLEVLLGAGHNNAPFELVVVDDGSRDRTPALLEGCGNRIRVVRHETNLGFASACNDGAAVASGELLVFLNNDTIPQAGWLDELVAYMGTHPDAVVVGAKLLYPDDTVQHAGVVIDQYGYAKHIYAGFPAWHPATCRSRRFQAVTAACLLVSRRAFDRLDGFDAAFCNGFEDIDFCLRAAALGEVHYCAESVVYHLESMSEGRFTRAAANERLWDERWRGRVVRDDFRYYAEDGLIGIRYTDSYPMRLDISPLLAVVEGNEFDRRSDHLLGLRSRRSFAMTKEIARLNGRRARSVQRVSHGTAQWLSPSPAHRLVTVLVQAGDSPDAVHATVKAVLDQQADEIVEVVALDAHQASGVREELTALGATVVAVDDSAENAVSALLRWVHGEIVVLLAPEALPADRKWLAALVHRVDGGAVVSCPGMLAVAARADVVRERPPAALHPAALSAWGEQLLRAGIAVEEEAGARVSTRALSPLERFARGVVEERLDPRTPDALGAGAADEGSRSSAGDLAEALGRAVERGGHARDKRDWIEDAAAGRIAAGVWGERS